MANKINIDVDWKFFFGNIPPEKETDGWGGAKARAYSFGAVSEDFDDANWRNVDIPHDFVVEGDYTQMHSAASDMQKIPEMESMDSRHFAGGSLTGGIAWYRKHFDIPSDYEGKRIYLCFDGVYRNSDVYLNEYYIGNHKNGYTSFYYDITDFVNMGGSNILAVRVDASGREGWWYEGGGIYRHVWLEVRDSVYVEKWGTFVASEVDLNNSSAELTVKTEVVNRNTVGKYVTVRSEINNADGETIAVSESKMDMSEWSSEICIQHIRLDEANLWDLENTYMYSLKTMLYVNGECTDTNITPFGIRDIRFDAETGIYLNGKNIRIKGLCCHHDHSGVGIAVPESLWKYRMEYMKEMGANGYRSAHHPPTPELLDICDKMGILVLDETRRMSSCNDDIEALKSLVKRDRNHPSVFLWGIGNEEVFSQNREETARATVTMKMELRSIDNTRPVTSAVVCWNGKERFNTAEGYVHVTKNLDVMGFNYCRSAWDDYHRRMSSQPVIITEASANSWTRGCYSTNETRAQYYIFDESNADKCKSGQKAVKKDVAEAEWKYFAERPYLGGIFLWTGMDYRGEPTPLAYPAVYSQFGIFDYCGFAKDNYYYYKSWWTDKSVLHVFPDANFMKNAGERVTMYCYSNADEVELFVNGKSIGRKAMERNGYLSWDAVQYNGGEIVALGYKDGEEYAKKILAPSGVPYAIELTPYKSEIRGGDTAVVNIKIVDKDGKLVPYADNEICFSVGGTGAFLGCGNGNPGDHSSDKLPVRRAFNGLCQVLVKGKGAGEIELTAESCGIQTGKCCIKVI